MFYTLRYARDSYNLEMPGGIIFRRLKEKREHPANAASIMMPSTTINQSKRKKREEKNAAAVMLTMRDRN
jgi:predicted alpha-1,6-mannanase (GH76 family)